ncbi:MAG: hypothetical protein PUC61_08840 [Bacteroidales bacterium]|nr:hypothetical protein [Bacteroidales bacterium]
MDLTFKQAMDLIVTPKLILESDGKLCAQKELDIQAGFSDNITLRSEDEEFLFKWTIRQSSRELCKLSLNIIDKDTSAGLFRIDYVAETARHPNPCIVSDDVPEELKGYAGKEIYGPHAHFNVLGYQPLVWARPLADMGYETVSIVNENGMVDIVPAIYSFARFINVKTPLEVQMCII